MCDELDLTRQIRTGEAKLWAPLSAAGMVEPLDRLDPNKTSFDGWEIVLYFMSLSFIIEGEPLSHIILHLRD